MNPSDIMLAILSRIYQQPITLVGLDSGLPVIKSHYEYGLAQITSLVKGEVDSSTGPLYNEIVRIKSIVDAMAKAVSNEQS